MSLEISAISGTSRAIVENETDAMLEEVMSRAFEAANDTQILKNVELTRIQDYRNAISPEDLYLYQSRASEYNLTVSLYSALSRKAVNAIDTLIRA